MINPNLTIMKDNAPGAFMVFFMAIVLLILIDDYTRPENDSDSPQMVEIELKEEPKSDLATMDEIE